ncbi:peptidase C14 caspase catalytic subunit p20 [Calothrix sp. NIES-4071]|nr:peptidase C14 caspase catalytic subunit p20 [Calothrix sp. NIES-4071]BAZ63124.1 peptidase C14 caspase catalytic subunit p20 [Calothrix sp. NIES-4105]
MMKRRTFLQRIGSVLAVLGITEAEWLSLGNDYYQALAQTSSRKLALLVGINNYSQFPSLSGCLTDVELQKQLLIYRFGFQLSDILCLTDEKASKNSIQKAFDDFSNQVNPGDVVFFHFSGYASYIKSQKALILFDDNPKEQRQVNYLLEETLQLILRALPTENVIAVLDTSYNLNHAKNCSLKVRAQATPDNIDIADNELDYQNQLKSKLGATPKALVLSATSNPNESARESQMLGFNAGLFTYALTQYLWENTQTATVQVGLAKVNSTIQQLGGNQQSTLLNSKKIQQLGTFASNFSSNVQAGAEGAITSVEEDGRTAQLWLGGVPPHVLEYLGVNSKFAIVSTVSSLVMRSRSGLTAKASLRAETTSTETPVVLQVGQLIQEVVRVIPRNIHLNIGLDKLERIERVDATSAFATFNYISSTSAEPADYIFGKLLDKTQETGSVMVSSSRYGLFTLSGELIANTVGEVGEAVKLAAQRLAPKLQAILASKLWRLTENEASSLLNVKVTLETIMGAASQPIMVKESLRTQQFDTRAIKSNGIELNKLSIGNRIQYQVENKSTQTLYLMLLGLDTSKNVFGLCAWQNPTENTPSHPSLQNITIEPGATITVPQTNPGFEWIMQGLSDSWEVQIILSTAPFTQTLTALAATKVATGQQRIVAISNPLEVVSSILQDLHDVNKERKEASDTYVWNVNNWASFNFVFQAK